jgi:hypothetical protein
MAVFGVSWPFLCLRLSTRISCFLHILSKQVDKTKFPKSGRKFNAFCSASSNVLA